MSTPEPYPVHLGSIDFDGTADGNGIIWLCDNLDGWYSAPDVLSAELDTFPDGIVVTAARNRGRAIVLNGAAVIPRAHPELWFIAADTLNAQSDLLLSSGLLLVDEPTPKQAYVRRTGTIKTTRVGNAVVSALTFQVPLKAADPRKYAQTAVTDNSTWTLTGTSTQITPTLTPGGTTLTPMTVSIDGPAVNPYLQNLSISGSPYVRWNGTLGGGDTLVIDFANRTMLKNGSNAYGNIDVHSIWFYLYPTANSLRYARAGGSGTSTAAITYRPAYI